MDKYETTMICGGLLVLLGIFLAIQFSPWWILMSAFYLIATPYYARRND